MNSFKNYMKTAMLMGALMALFGVVGSIWGQQGLLIALIFGGVMNIGAWFFSDKLAIAAMQGREIDARSAPDLYAMVQRLSSNAGIPMPRIYICPHDAPNAFATGRSPKRSAVAVTQGLLRIVEPRELEGIIAHELAHIRNRDTLISCIAATLAGVLAMIAQYSFFLVPRGRGSQGANPLVAIVTVLIAAVGAALIQAAISRTREYAADEAGARIAGSPDGLASALQKLDAYSKRIPLVQPNPAQNNLFIIEPLAAHGRGGNMLFGLFATHPPTEKRIAALRSMHLRG